MIEERNGRISFGTPSLKRAVWPLFLYHFSYEPGAVPLRLLLPGVFLRKKSRTGKENGDSGKRVSRDAFKAVFSLSFLECEV